ncbi:MAG: hypothetical protein HOV81_12045 [Kofleriaceae bacterium]|nr:hypothetical protein [Kofleriaceae bacterium]
MIPPDQELRITGLAVVSHDSSGAMCSTVTGRGDSGERMMIDVPPGGMVTMVEDTNRQGRGLFTWTEVQPGDELAFPSPVRDDLSPQTVQVALTIPTVPTAGSYEVFLQCEHGGGGLGESAPAGAYTRALECPPTSTSIAAYVITEATDSPQIAVSAVTPIATTGTTTLTVGPWMTPARPTITLRGAAGFDLKYAGFSPGAASGFQSVTHLSSTSGATDPATIPPRDLPPTWRNHVTVAVGTNASPRAMLAIARDQATPTSLDLTVGTDFMPMLSAQLTAPLPRPTITWTVPGSVPAADIVLANAGRWLIAARPQNVVRFPEVPASLLPAAPASVLALMLIDGQTITSFDEVRKDPVRVHELAEFRSTSLGDQVRAIVP